MLAFVSLILSAPSSEIKIIFVSRAWLDFIWVTIIFVSGFQNFQKPCQTFSNHDIILDVEKWIPDWVNDIMISVFLLSIFFSSNFHSHIRYKHLQYIFFVYLSLFVQVAWEDLSKDQIMLCWQYQMLAQISKTENLSQIFWNPFFRDVSEYNALTSSVKVFVAKKAVVGCLCPSFRADFKGIRITAHQEKK